MTGKHCQKNDLVQERNMGVTTALSRIPQGSDFQIEDTCVSLYQGSNFRVADNASTRGEESILRDANTLVKVTPPARIKIEDITTALNMTPQVQIEDTCASLCKGSDFREVDNEAQVSSICT
jgi:hypothetical protein